MGSYNPFDRAAQRSAGSPHTLRHAPAASVWYQNERVPLRLEPTCQTGQTNLGAARPSHWSTSTASEVTAPCSDEFPPGWGFFFVTEAEAKRLVEGSALGTVRFSQEAYEPSSFAEHGAHVGFCQQGGMLARSPPVVDYGARRQDIGLDFGVSPAPSAGSMPARRAASTCSSSAWRRRSR